MPRRLLQIVPTPLDVLNLSMEELARALLEDMQARAQDPTSGHKPTGPPRRTKTSSSRGA